MRFASRKKPRRTLLEPMSRSPSATETNAQRPSTGAFEPPARSSPTSRTVAALMTNWRRGCVPYLSKGGRRSIIESRPRPWTLCTSPGPAGTSPESSKLEPDRRTTSIRTHSSPIRSAAMKASFRLRQGCGRQGGAINELRIRPAAPLCPRPARPKFLSAKGAEKHDSASEPERR